MTKDMYFVPILARAVGHPQARSALKAAFLRIQSLAQDQPRGFSQFCRFMTAVAENSQGQQAEGTDEATIEPLILELATDSFEGSEDERQAAQELVLSRRQWRDQFEQLKAELDEIVAPMAVPHLLLRREDRTLVSISLGQGNLRRTVANITPGRYLLELDSGRLLWEASLTSKDLVFSAAFPGRPLALAADTGEFSLSTTRQEILAGGKLIIRVVPGIETGCIQIESRL